MANGADVRIERWDEATCLARAEDLAGLFASLWPEDDWSGFAAKLAGRRRLSAVVALDAADAVAGAKIGYDLYRDVHYSWLGGVRADARGAGLAARLMDDQHAWMAELGLTWIQTSTRQPNRTMAIVNLKAGFEVVGVEAVPGEPTKVVFRKRLDGPS